MKEIKMVGKYVNALSKLGIFNLTQFDKCVFLDSDLVIYQNIDDLFNKPDWSAVEDCLPYHKRPQNYVLGESSFCSGMFVFTPDTNFYNKLLAQLISLPQNIKWHDQAILAYNNQDWMQRPELHLPCEYDLLVAAQEDVLNLYLSQGGKQEDIKVKHFVSHKDAPYDAKPAYYFWDNVYEEYYDYYLYINSIIMKYNLKLECCHMDHIYRLFEKDVNKSDIKTTIDLVVPYVDCTDENWKKLFCKYNPNSSKDINGIERFRGQGEFFRFFFRGIEANLPWIGNIYLLVSSKSQVPSWIDQTKVKIITHEQFIPKEYLPTFNSCTIEMFLWNIPGLREYFLYLNDDFFITHYITMEKFFDYNKALFSLKKRQILSSMYDHHCANNYNLLFKNKDYYLHLNHEIRPLFKSKVAACYNKYKAAINKSISRFRADTNFNVYLYLLYMFKENLQIESNLKEDYLDSKANLNIFKLRNDPIKPVLCINDTSEEFSIYDNKNLFWQFYSRFPKKSIYELNDFSKKPKNPHEQKSYGQSNTYLYF